MPTVATAAVRGDNHMEESLAGDGELKIILICFLYLINISSSSFVGTILHSVDVCSAAGGRNSK